MGCRILATGVEANPALRGALDPIVAAARSCLSAAGRAPADIDVLIHTGLYRDENMVEPAMAALLQQRLGIRLGAGPEVAVGVSFDLMNGACGVVSAVQAASALLALGDARHVLVVSGDAHPSGQRPPEFPYATVGGAILLGQASRGGFGRARFQDAEDVPGAGGFVDIGAPGGRDRITVSRPAGFVDHALEHLAGSVAAWAEAEGSRLEGSLLVTSRLTADFPVRLATRLGLDPSSVAAAPEPRGDPHSSALTWAWHHAAASGQLDRFERVIFAAVGAGITSAVVGYQP